MKQKGNIDVPQARRQTAKTRRPDALHPVTPVRADPGVAFSSARILVRAWAAAIPQDAARLVAAQVLIAETVERYACALEALDGAPFDRTPAPRTAGKLDKTMQHLTEAVAATALLIDETAAAFEIGTLYTLALPVRLRSNQGVYYTPPLLTERLLDMAEDAGVDWRTARILDPACGGGAFLAPAAKRIVAALDDCLPPLVLQNIAGRIRGLELDPFAAWMSQAFLEITLRAVTRAAGRTLPAAVTVCDSLDAEPPPDGFDLVIGNPPFGRLSLSAAQRARYKRSLFGHANLYGVFLDLALRWTKAKGVVAFVTPTSFLAGEYFKALRALLAEEAPPHALDLIADRKGVFEDVLQETALSTFRRGGKREAAHVRHLRASGGERIDVADAGVLKLPADPHAPWILPRAPEDAALVKTLAGKRTRLADWGYAASTGPLVWNRHKPQLTDRKTAGAYPLIWAESVTLDGQFLFRAQRRNHAPYFRAVAGDDWLIAREPCVLLQRTTAKEQHRRLIAAELPASFIAKHGAVVVENHLNMLRPTGKGARVSPAALAALLNSRIADRAFRCISGSVAVSAFELEALPLPTVKQMAAIERMLARGAPRAEIETKFQSYYQSAGKK